MSLRCAAAAIAALCWLACGSVCPAADEPHDPAAAAAEHGPAAGEHAAGEHAASSTATDPLSIDPDLVIATFLIFGLLYVVLSKFAWGPILEALEAREHAVDDNLAAAQRAHEQAKMLLADYERRLAQAHEEVRGILEAARRDAEHQKQGIVAEARSAALAERERALGDIDQAAGRAINDLAERSAALAIDLAGRIVRGPLAPLDQAALAREALGELAAIRPRNH